MKQTSSVTSSAASSLGNFLLDYFDFFGQPPALRILEKKKFTSGLGCFMTILVGTITLAFFVTQIITLQEKSQPKVFYSQQQIFESAAFPLQNDNFTLAVSVTNPEGIPIKGQLKYYNISIQQCTRLRTVNATTNITQVTLNCTALPMDLCQESDFDNDLQKNFFKNAKLDFTGIGTHSGCLSKLSGCTTDGTNCLAQAKCATYGSQAICENAYGTDGPQGECFWDATLTTPACRIMACSDIKTGQTATLTCQASLTSCVSDGTNCIAKAGCSTYTTKTGCNSGGTDGPCVFTASTVANATAGTGTCKLMTACADASSDQSACQSQSVKYKCSWTAQSITGNTTKASVCATHNCQTYQQAFGSCGNFLNWASSLQQVCLTVNGTCTATDPTTLTADSCFSATAYAYTWSASTSKCGVCTAVVVQPNNTNNTNNTNTTNDTTTTSGYILGFASVVLGYLVF